MKKKKDKFSLLDEIDFFVDPRPLTKKDNLRLSEIIAAYKAKQKKAKPGKKSSSRKQAA